MLSNLAHSFLAVYTCSQMVAYINGFRLPLAGRLLLSHFAVQTENIGCILNNDLNVYTMCQWVVKENKDDAIAVSTLSVSTVSLLLCAI